MKYYSLNHNAPKVSFEEAVIQGLATDKGLYFPESITPLNANFFENIENLSNSEIAFEAIKQFVGDEIPAETLKQINQWKIQSCSFKTKKSFLTSLMNGRLQNILFRKKK